MWFFKSKFFIVLSLVILGCSLEPAGKNVKLSIEMRESPRALPFVQAPSEDLNYSLYTGPASVNGFDCFVVNVDGVGIPSLSPDRGKLEDILAGSHCTGGGVTSGFFPVSYSGSMNLFVPAGPQRVIQVLGIDSNIGCPADKTLGDFIISSHQEGQGMSTNFPGIVEVGRTVTDLFGNVTLNIQNSYSSANIKDLNQCGGGPVDLALVAGLSGCNTGYSTYTGTLEYVTSAGTGGISTSMSGATLALLDDSGNSSTTVQECPTATDYPRMDFIFDLSGYNLADYYAIQIDVKGRSGDTGISCGGGQLPANNQSIQVLAYAGGAGSPNWPTTNIQSSTATGVPMLNYEYNPAYGGSPADFATTIDSSNHLVISVRGTSAAPTYCRSLEVYEVRARLVK